MNNGSSKIQTAMFAATVVVAAFLYASDMTARAEIVSLYCSSRGISPTYLDVDYAASRITIEQAHGVPRTSVRAQISDRDILWELPAPKNVSGWITTRFRYRLDRFSGDMIFCGGYRGIGEPDCSEPQQCVPQTHRF
jgi:hypothetical protein